ncbi:GcrA family cell cycle regulator [Aureimonas sp. SK2]|uniref:GcrA family cell cycle regulator n=1 Tax=Aureimonas sp. SK2 TaxID=3015992 RepID=UPI002443E05F|nr:GcrA family cell cycle regulator [Aureimonas sp. SK2]
MSQVPWSEDVIEKVRELAAAGKSASKIGAEIGASRNAVIGLCHRRGITLGFQPHTALIAGARLVEVQRLVGAGVPADEIARRFGVPKHAVLRSLRRAGTAIRTLAPHPVSPSRPSRLPVLPAEPRRPFVRSSFTAAELAVIARQKADAIMARDRVLAEAFRPTADARPVVTASGCRWPLWSADAALPEKLVCGKSRSIGATYCETDAALAYRPPEDRRAACNSSEPFIIGYFT